MKIIEVASEVVPFAKTGGLADVVGAMPVSLEKLKHDITIFMPFYKAVREKNLNITPMNVTVEVPVGDSIRTGYLWKTTHPHSKNISVIFIQRDEYFQRDQLYGTESGDYLDNAERFIFFCRAVLETIKLLKMEADVIHCHDWQTALIPIYLKTLYKEDKQFSALKSVLTVHNLAFQGVFWHWDIKLTGLDWALFNWRQLEHWGKLNLLKGGIVFADALTTVSQKYAEEIKTEEFGCGLESVLQEYETKLHGIINGVDYSQWSPDTDEFLPAKYSIHNMRGKSVCKRQLRKRAGFPNNTSPVIGMVTRLTNQKGIDLLVDIINELMKRELQLVILGSGDDNYQQMLKKVANVNKEKLSITIAFDNELAHLIEAGSDMFLMPSRFEPCGLNQMYSLKYGALPIVRKTGGLADTIVDANEENIKNGSATGFVFEEYSSGELLFVIDRALKLYQSKAKWNAVRKTAMAQDWSWAKSASKYHSLFTNL